MPTIVPPGRNKTLAVAWKAHKAAQRAEGKKKPEPAGNVDFPDPQRSGKKSTPVVAKKAAKKKARAK